MIPPREAELVGILWNLEIAAYGLTNLGRLWYLTSDNVLISRHRLTRLKLDYTLYFSLDANQHLKFILAIQVDDYMYSGKEIDMKSFKAFFRSTFNVSKLARGSLEIMRCKIT